ncbi:DUF4136 domain-containing protein [Pacificoceanicola onchidii]|uniref:DUF4136 domain-containing protein n=1 Tax=Pacificoceanicola onchidii TaxID=2562685 RepID=UPI003B82E450
MKTHVDAYSSIPKDLDSRTIYLTPYSESQVGPQWRTNAGILATVLAEKGFEVVQDRSKARLIAFFGFAVDKGEQVQSTYSIPQWGVTGYSGATTTGTIYGNSYNATTTLTPTYGVTGYSTGTVTSTVYTRSVAIDMFDTVNKELVFEATAVSRGSCNSFTPVAGAIIRAVLTNFPNGKTGTVTLPMDNEC